MTLDGCIAVLHRVVSQIPPTQHLIMVFLPFTVQLLEQAVKRFLLSTWLVAKWNLQNDPTVLVLASLNN